MAQAARQLGLHESQLYQWRNQQEHQQTVSQREQEQATEMLRLRRELAVAQEEVAILCVLRETNQVKYAFIQTHSQLFNLKSPCRLLKVCSGYYEWQQQHRIHQRQQRHTELDRDVARLFVQSKASDGARRLQRRLLAQGKVCNRKTVAASLHRQKLVAKAARKFKATTNSHHHLPVFENLLMQNFTATAPNQKSVGDITYLATDEGWLYLAIIIGLFPRQVMGWAMSERMTADLVCDALQMAVFKRKRPNNVIVYSDRDNPFVPMLTANY